MIFFSKKSYIFSSQIDSYLICLRNYKVSQDVAKASKHKATHHVTLYDYKSSWPRTAFPDWVRSTNDLPQEEAVATFL